MLSLAQLSPSLFETSDFVWRLQYPFIDVEEKDQPKSFSSEIFKAVIDNDKEYLESLIEVIR